MTKYIIVRKGKMEMAILLFPLLSHDHAVNPVRLKQDGAKLVSAGFFEFDRGQIQIGNGGSTTLRVESRLEDREAIANTLHLMGLQAAPTAPVQARD